jgi:hypothetical protein
VPSLKGPLAALEHEALVLERLLFAALSILEAFQDLPVDPMLAAAVAFGFVITLRIFALNGLILRVLQNTKIQSKSGIVFVNIKMFQ